MSGPEKKFSPQPKRSIIHPASMLENFAASAEPEF